MWKSSCRRTSWWKRYANPIFRPGDITYRFHLLVRRQELFHICENLNKGVYHPPRPLALNLSLLSDSLYWRFLGVKLCKSRRRLTSRNFVHIWFSFGALSKNFLSKCYSSTYDRALSANPCYFFGKAHFCWTEHMGCAITPCFLCLSCTLNFPFKKETGSILPVAGQLN